MRLSITVTRPDIFFINTYNTLSTLEIHCATKKLQFGGRLLDLVFGVIFYLPYSEEICLSVTPGVCPGVSPLLSRRLYRAGHRRITICHWVEEFRCTGFKSCLSPVCSLLSTSFPLCTPASHSLTSISSCCLLPLLLLSLFFVISASFICPSGVKRGVCLSARRKWVADVKFIYGCLPGAGGSSEVYVQLKNWQNVVRARTLVYSVLNYYKVDHAIYYLVK